MISAANPSLRHFCNGIASCNTLHCGINVECLGYKQSWGVAEWKFYKACEDRTLRGWLDYHHGWVGWRPWWCWVRWHGARHLPTSRDGHVDVEAGTTQTWPPATRGAGMGNNQRGGKGSRLELQQGPGRVCRASPQQFIVTNSDAARSPGLDVRDGVNTDLSILPLRA